MPELKTQVMCKYGTPYALTSSPYSFLRVEFFLVLVKEKECRIKIEYSLRWWLGNFSSLNHTEDYYDYNDYDEFSL